jgi:hypothetical protein
MFFYKQLFLTVRDEMMQTDFILAFTPSAGGFPELVTTYQPVMWEAFFPEG